MFGQNHFCQVGGYCARVTGLVAACYLLESRAVIPMLCWSYNVNINLLSRRSFCSLIHLAKEEKARNLRACQENGISDINAKSSLVNDDLGVVENPFSPPRRTTVTVN